MQRDLTLDIIKKLIQDESFALKDDLPTIIVRLLKPFSKSKNTKAIDAAIIKIVQSCGICGRCRQCKLKNKNDLFCKYCKSVLKERAKPQIV